LSRLFTTFAITHKASYAFLTHCSYRTLYINAWNTHFNPTTEDEKMTSSLKCAVMLTLLMCSTTLTHAQVRQHSDLPQGVSASWWQQVQEHIRKSEYHISKRSDGRYTSPNRAQNLRFVYEPNGFCATRRDSLAHLWQARLTFAGFSKSGASPESQHAHDFTLTADANTLVAQSDAIVIKYCNDEKGMRQDFIVKRKPDGNGDLRLWLYAEMQGGTVSTTAEQISFLTESGAEAMRYSDLKVWDANQKRLKARFEKVGNQVAIVVSDRKAMYPITIDPLSTTPNWTAESNQANAEFGYSVASAGDVNGDGFSDVIVGAPLFDNGETDEGRAFVYHGSASGLSTTPNWTAESNQVNALFGNSVASAGDVNGDGFSDVIVGAWLFDNGETDEGRAFVYHGSASGLSTTPNWTAESNQALAWFGFSVASAGDVNGDGFSDVIVGAYLFDNGETNEGRAFVYHGSANGVNNGVPGTPANAAWTAESNQANAQFGSSVASAGDVNGDGFSDVIVGAYWFDNGQTDEGAAFVYYGNGGIGLRQDIRQFRPSTTTPIVPALKTTSPNSVTLQKRRQSIAGRSNVKLQFEVKPLGTAFNGTGLTESVFTLHGVGGTPTPLLISGLSNKTLYKWRVRQVERSTGIGYILLPRSRWYYPAGVAPTESHFQVSDDDLPLPVELLSFRGELTLQGVQLTWETASEVNNAGFVLQRRHSGETTYTEIASYLTHPALRGLGTSPMGKIYTYLDASRLNEGESYYYRLQDVDFNGNITEHAEIEVSVVRAYRLMQNYPNPFNPSTVISYQLPVASEVSLKVFDVLGREVAVLVSGRQKAGNYVVPFNGSGLSSGVYFYRLQAGQFVQTRKMMLVK
jgi:hypothetical protein